MHGLNPAYLYPWSHACAHHVYSSTDELAGLDTGHRIAITARVAITVTVCTTCLQPRRSNVNA
jgi:hypothetical protein